jgi:hypothetical protein
VRIAVEHYQLWVAVSALGVTVTIGIMALLTSTYLPTSLRASGYVSPLRVEALMIAIHGAVT